MNIIFTIKAFMRQPRSHNNGGLPSATGNIFLAGKANITDKADQYQFKNTPPVKGN